MLLLTGEGEEICCGTEHVVVCFAQVFLVGDPVQLPATVISSRAIQHGYDTSLFKRLQSSGFPVQACTQPPCKSTSVHLGDHALSITQYHLTWFKDLENASDIL